MWLMAAALCSLLAPSPASVFEGGRGTELPLTRGINEATFSRSLTPSLSPESRDGRAEQGQSQQAVT